MATQQTMHRLLDAKFTSSLEGLEEHIGNSEDMGMRGKPGIGGSQLDYSSGVIDKTAADAGASGGGCSH
jgi:hypothetical protein